MNHDHALCSPLPNMMRTFRNPLDLTDAQRITLCFWLAACSYVYNWALRRRQEQYDAHQRGETTKKGLTNFDQKKELVAFRVMSVALMKVPSDVLRSAINFLDRAFEDFFRRVANGEKPGYPRVRRGDRYDSFAFPWEHSEIVGTGRSARLWIPILGYVKVNLYRPLKGTPKEIIIHREATGKWWACISCDLGEAPAKLELAAIPDNRRVGIDVGIKSIVATSDGECVGNPKFFAKSAALLKMRQRRVVKRTRKGSNGRTRAKQLVAKAHKHIANQRRDFAFKLAKQLVKENDLIAVERLNVAGLARGTLSKSVHDAGWSNLLNAIRCKAEEAGTIFIEVDPAYTTQTCSNCGDVKRKELSERVHHCTKCGLRLDRDVNAARVILARGVTALGMSVGKTKADATKRIAKVRRSRRVSTAQPIDTQS